MTQTVEASAAHRFDSATAEQVYDAWLDPADVRVWMFEALRSFGMEPQLERVDIDARDGGTFFFSDLRDGAEAKHWGAYRALDRPRSIEFTWFTSEEDERDGASLVRIDITPHGRGCSVVVTHTMSAAYAEYLGATARGWTHMLEAIDATRGFGDDRTRP